VTSIHKEFQDAQERFERLREGRSFIVPLAAAIIAVLAALGTLFAHHRSIAALAVKNEALLAQSRASDQYAYYQAKRMKFTIYSALVTAHIAKDAKSNAALAAVANHEQKTSLAILASARKLEQEAGDRQEESAVVLKSFETLEVGATLFEIAIVFVSVSALAGARVLLYLGIGLSAIGIVYTIIGFIQPH
jgi:hypothetical protein